METLTNPSLMQYGNHMIIWVESNQKDQELFKTYFF